MLIPSGTTEICDAGIAEIGRHEARAVVADRDEPVDLAICSRINASA